MPDKEIYSLIFPGGGMNQDDSPLNFPQDNAGVSMFEQGDYRYARNVRIGSTSENNRGALENVPSTLSIDTYLIWNGSVWTSGSPPAGTNTSIGKCEDIKNRCIYEFIWNSNGDHLIMRVSRSDRRELLRWNGLNFKQSHIISSWIIGPYLCFTSKQTGDIVSNSPQAVANPPRIIDYTDIFQMKADLGSDFQEFHISYAKWAPQSPPVIKQAASDQSEYLEEGIYQFAYRYVYRGGFRSSFSPFSWFYSNQMQGTPYAVDISIPGFIFRYNDRANTAFGHDVPAFYMFTEYIELMYRESETDVWKLFRRYEVQTSGNTAFQFSNTGPSAVIPSNESAQPFDSVPFYAGCGEGIDNRTILADNTDELPVPAFEVENVGVVQRHPYNDNWNTPSGYTSLSPADLSLLNSIQSRRQFSFKERGIYKLGILFKHWTGRTWQVITKDYWSYIIPIIAKNLSSAQYHFEGVSGLQFTIPSGIIPPDGAVSYQIVRTNCLNIEYFLHGIMNSVDFLQNDANNLNDSVSTPAGMQSVLNDYFDNQALASNEQNRKLSDRTVSFVRKNKLASTVNAASQLQFWISNWIMPTSANSGASADNTANYLYYTFRKGDRVRFIGNVSGPITYDVFDEEIIEYTGKSIIINKPAGLTSMKTRGITGASEPEFFIEIYRPKKITEQPVFYECSEWYPVIEPCTPNRDFAKRNWLWSDPTAVTATTVSGNVSYNSMPVMTGDVWMVPRSMYYDYINSSMAGSVTLTSAQMNQDYRRAYDRWEHNTGRPASAYVYIPKVYDKLTQARFSLRYLQDSVFNGLNSFYDENQFIYPEEYGRIRAMVNTNNAQVESVGNIMLVLGEIEVWSVYVNRTTLEDLSGRTTVSISDKVLGSFNTLLGSFGTLNPESWARKNGRVVWWSQRNGCWARYSRDGMTDLSAVKMQNWFQEIADLIDATYSATPARCTATYDEFHDEWLTFITHPDMPASFRGYDRYKCVTFSERDKRWKSVYEYGADCFAFIGLDVYSLRGTSLVVHERGSGYGNFYGTVYPVMWEVIANKLATYSKAWRAVELIASDRWSMAVTGDWRSNGQVRQQSTVTLADLLLLEERYVAPVLQDSVTPNISNPEINGDEMRGRALLIMLTLDPAVVWLSVLNYLSVKSSDSPKNPKN